MSTSFFDDDEQDSSYEAQPGNRLPPLPQLLPRGGDLDHDDEQSYAVDDLNHDDSQSTSSYINAPNAVGTSSRGGARYSSVTNGGAGSSRYLASSSRGRADSPSLDDILTDHDDPDQFEGDPSFRTGRRETNVAKLMRAWMNESGSPELLKFPKRLVERLVKDLAARKALVRQVNATSSGDDALYLQASLVATENMRAAHVLKAYTRQRIHKLEQHAEYYLSIPDRDERLYHNEIVHAQGYVDLKRTYLETSALSALPDRIRQHEVPVAEPDLSTAVFCRVRREACGPVVLPDGSLMSFEKGSQHMLRYSTIRELLANDSVELM